MRRRRFVVLRAFERGPGGPGSWSRYVVDPGTGRIAGRYFEDLEALGRVRELPRAPRFPDTTPVCGG